MKPFVKMDMVTYIIFLVISIVIPPLFIINLILFLVQIIPRVIIAVKENKENKKFEEFVRKAQEEKQRKEFEEMLKKIQEIEQQNDIEKEIKIPKDGDGEGIWGI